MAHPFLTFVDSILGTDLAVRRAESLVTASDPLPYPTPTPPAADATHANLDSQITKSVPLGMAIPPGQNNRPVFSGWTVERAVRHGLKTSSWVYVCARKVAVSVASLPFVVRASKDGDLLPNHPLQDLLSKPNAFWTQTELVERLVYHLLLGGNGLLSKIRVMNNMVVELWALPPDKVKPIASRTEFVKAYEFRSGSDRELIQPEDMIHIMFCDPDNPHWGLSPVQAGSKNIDIDSESLAWNKTALENRARTSGVLAVKHPLNRLQWEEFRRQVFEQHMGSRNAYVPWVLGNDAEWMQMDRSPVEMDFIAGRRMSREEICALFGVPPVLVGILDRATYSNYETARTVFWQDTVLPLAEFIRDSLNESLAADFGNVYIDIDLSGNDILSGISESDVERASKLFAMGVPMSVINERLSLGLPDYPGIDIGYVSGAFQPSAGFSVDPMVPGEGVSRSGYMPAPRDPVALLPSDLQEQWDSLTAEEKNGLAGRLQAVVDSMGSDD